MNIFWTIFLKQRKKNGLLASGMVFFSLASALLEGVSFVCLLAGLAKLTHEPLAIPQMGPFKDINLCPFYLWLTLAIGLQVFKSIVLYLAQLLTAKLTINIQQEAQKQIFERIFKMSFAQIAQMKKGDLMHSATAPPSFVPMLFDEYNRLIISTFMVCAYLGLMCVMSLSLACLIVFLFLIAACLQKFLFNKITKASHIHTDHIAELNKQTAQSLDGMKTVHIFQRQTHILTKIGMTLERISTATMRLKKLNALIPSANETLGVLLVGVALLMSVFILQKAAYLITFLTLTYRLATRMHLVMISVGVIAYYSGPLKRLKDSLSSKIVVKESKGEVPLRFEGSIAFENVSFIYPSQQSHTLNDITLTIPKGHVVALVGISGAGKSTLTDLLLNLYEPTQGSIKIDGIPLAFYSLESLRNLFGVVMQDPFLFNTSIEENIRFGKVEATEGEVKRAAELAGASTFIEKLPEAYQTIVGEKGYRLSGGEKQRISFAQALIRDSEVLVLDEPTSQLDSHSEQIIQKTIAALRDRKTIIVIAHRLATIQMADQIYVLENGRIIERGTHRHLLQLGGRYQMFWNLQTFSHVYSP